MACGLVAGIAAPPATAPAAGAACCTRACPAWLPATAAAPAPPALELEARGGACAGPLRAECGCAAPPELEDLLAGPGGRTRRGGRTKGGGRRAGAEPGGTWPCCGATWCLWSPLTLRVLPFEVTWTADAACWEQLAGLTAPGSWLCGPGSAEGPVWPCCGFRGGWTVYGCPCSVVVARSCLLSREAGGGLAASCPSSSDMSHSGV